MVAAPCWQLDDMMVHDMGSLLCTVFARLRGSVVQSQWSRCSTCTTCAISLTDLLIDQVFDVYHECMRLSRGMDWAQSTCLIEEETGQYSAAASNACDICGTAQKPVPHMALRLGVFEPHTPSTV